MSALETLHSPHGATASTAIWILAQLSTRRLHYLYQETEPDLWRPKKMYDGSDLPQLPAGSFTLGQVLPPTYEIPKVRDWHPSPLMRRLGYAANPDTCRHRVKGYTPRDGWWCKDCGEPL